MSTGVPGPPFAQIIEHNMLGLYRYYAARGQGICSDVGGIVRYESSIPVTSLNGVFSTGFDGEITDRVIARALEPFAARRCSMFWWLGDGAPHRRVASRLRSRGLFAAPPMPGLAASLAELPLDAKPPRELAILPLSHPEEITGFLLLQNEALGSEPGILEALVRFNLALGLDPDLPLRRYVGLVDGRPVASCILFLHGAAAGIYSLSTRPEFRRRGFGAAMTLAALRHARTAGARCAVLEASEMGYALYRTLGFREYARYHTALFRPAALRTRP
ncbi:MAG TPA: GNAT family N-acetyltransferase [Candidatus Dormibacteraeota bacterium]|nr:GNAT family N-acetyltransferase [Candidatus Dormibacteraeota bacterium]